jgi:hypothetical protein
MADNTDLYRDARGQFVDLISDYDKAVNTLPGRD